MKPLPILLGIGVAAGLKYVKIIGTTDDGLRPGSSPPAVYPLADVAAFKIFGGTGAADDPSPFSWVIAGAAGYLVYRLAR